MTVTVLLLSLVMAAASTAGITAQALEGLAGIWALDRAVSTFGQGDPGADRVEIALTPPVVRVARFFNSPEPSVWTLALDGSSPPPPQRGSARVIDGKLVITHERASEVVTHVYTVEGNTLLVERSISAKSTNPGGGSATHVMVYRKIG